ncbi:MAG TPA: ABC transporter permease [Firmicutes bacterium]|nr:ABC transporter permease [Bacillota bacterium]
MINILTYLFSGAVQSGTSVLYGVYGEILSERVGVINLGLEGSMVMGAFGAYAATAQTGSPLLGVLAGMLLGGLLALIHAYLVIARKANQLATGLTLMFLGLGITAFFGRGYVSASIGGGLSAIKIPLLSDIPVIGGLFEQDILTYLSYLLGPALWFLLFKTRFGMLLRGTGESEEVVYAYGLNPKRMRYIGVVMGGMLAGLGGAQLSIAYTKTWIEGMTNGRGVIAVALVILATWQPLKAYIGAYIFGGAQSLQLVLQQQGYDVSPFLLLMLPYLLTLIALFIVSRRKRQVMPAELKKIVESSVSS